MNWSDESLRKMTTRITIWGTEGRLFADRQECQIFLRDTAAVPDGYTHGWNVRYTTDLTDPVWFYVRGEEYSAQIDYFVQRVKDRSARGQNEFRSAAVTDHVLAMLVADAAKGASTRADAATESGPTATKWANRVEPYLAKARPYLDKAQGLLRESRHALRDRRTH